MNWTHINDNDARFLVKFCILSNTTIYSLCFCFNSSLILRSSFFSFVVVWLEMLASQQISWSHIFWLLIFISITNLMLAVKMQFQFISNLRIRKPFQNNALTRVINNSEQIFSKLSVFFKRTEFLFSSKR